MFITLWSKQSDFKTIQFKKKAVESGHVGKKRYANV